MENIIILGTGCAGLTAAIYAARAGLRPLVLEGNLPGGQLTTTTEVENYPGYPEGIDGYTLTDNMRRQAARFGARYVSATASRLSVTPGSGVKQLHTAGADGACYETHALVIATGTTPRLLGIPGEREHFGGNGVSTCATCDGAFYEGMDVVVVGGGDSACEEALFLTRFASRVHLVHRRDTLRASEIMARRVRGHAGIATHWNHLPVEVRGDATGKVRALAAKNRTTGDVVEIPCKGLFVAIGHEPNTHAFEGVLDRDANGYLVPTGSGGVGTRVGGVFVAGNCADPVYQQAIAAAGMGCRAAIEAERWLRENA
ncbi:MAG: FAD-dependent oxidoreductase [Puniceicoccales bacterium]|jgi:thioredoxin reductase (NADPH)|nr:FAD-dependent oxidoreductase [Puniceicoccales bacterium]